MKAALSSVVLWVALKVLVLPLHALALFGRCSSGKSSTVADMKSLGSLSDELGNAQAPLASGRTLGHSHV